MNIETAITISDLHLEWDKTLKDFSTVVPDKIADAIFLNGDIAGGTHALEFIDYLLDLGYVVFYILGNHEFYGHDMNSLIDEWRTVERDNFYFLHQNTVEFDNVRIIGAPLWASVGTFQSHPVYGYVKHEQIDWFTRQAIKEFGDFHHIPQFKPTVMASLFWSDFYFLENALAAPTDKKTVVMTHHLPTERSVNAKFKEAKTNCLFATELEHVFVDNEIDFWLHGHTHSSSDYVFHDTRIVCNPRGYHDINQLNQHFEWLKQIDFKD